MANPISYTPLEPEFTKAITGASSDFSVSGGFYQVSTLIYGLLFSAIIAGAFYRYVIAGLWRMEASENGLKKSNEIIKRVTLGLLGIFSLFLILFTVNRGLLTGDVNLEGFGGITSTTPNNNLITTPIKTPTGPNIPANNDDPTGWEAIRNDPAVRKRLQDYSILVNKSVCVTPTQTSCTTVGGLPEGTISMLMSLKDTCKSRINVTGGSEAGHKSHGPRKTPVDLSLNDSQLESCIRNFPPSTPLNFCKKTYTNFGYVFCDELGVSHWHVFK